ncbi:MAG: putative Inositol-phosphate phosphatase [Nitrospira sp.]
MDRELNLLVESVREAGVRALELSRIGFDVQTKRDRSPVTTADLEVNRILHEMQQKHFPEDGWLSEESPDDPARLGRARVWIVDPIDGTRAFIKKLPEFCISAALVENGRPLAAVIFNPSTDELFSAVRGGGLRVNGKPVSRPTTTDPPLVMVSPGEFRGGRWTGLGEGVRTSPFHSIAHALTLVATDRAQAAVTAEKENEWDLAAGVLLIEEAGGMVEDADCSSLKFNQPVPQFTGLLALAGMPEPHLQPLLRSHVARTGKQAPR